MRREYFVSLFTALLLAAGCTDTGSESETGSDLVKCEDSCENGFDCVDGYCKEAKAAGESCKSKDSYCSEGECVDGKCVVEASEDPCSESNPCAKSSEVCVGGKCQAKVGIGGVCSIDDMCSRGKCIDGKCRVEVQSGQACDESHTCVSGLSCNDGICKKPVGEGEDCRSSLVYCEGGVCDQGKCVLSGTDTCKDSDGDGISDEYDNCSDDTDHDGLVNCMDDDSDGDGIPDKVEFGSSRCKKPADSDNDGIPDFLDDDSDGNGILDKIEGFNADGSLADTDGDTILDSASSDNDGDGIEDMDEIFGLVNPLYEKMYGTEGPRGADCYHAKNNQWGVWGLGRIVKDARGVASYEACKVVEGDISCQLRMGDLVPDEMGTVEKPFDCDGDTVPDYKSLDSDGDGILDQYEGRIDSDGDGFYDRYELDSDNDYLSDSDELGSEPGSRPRVSMNNEDFDFRTPDIDGDGLEDGYEVMCWSSIECNEGERACGGKCISVVGDAQNCGGCGIKCPENSICEGETCVMACPDGLVDVDMTCVDPSKDNKHCGESLTQCMFDQVCTDGACVASGQDCGEQAQCWGKCTDLQSDADNCGGCGNACGAGNKCVEGACVKDCGDKSVCIAQPIRALEYCADLASDPFNCGECGKVCKGAYVCSNGECVESDVKCNGLMSACHGKCVNLYADAQNCGSCGHECSDIEFCDRGVCMVDISKVGDMQGVDSRFVKDTDGDGFGDASEYIAGEWYQENVDARIGGQEFICNPRFGVVSGTDKEGNEVTGAFDFYFTLPYQGSLKEEERTVEEDFLEFKPAVSMLDVIFNLDTTKSMGNEVTNLKNKISSFIIPEIKKRVTESAIGVSRFDDFPTRPTQNSKQYDFLQGIGVEDGGYGRADKSDKPFELVIRPETNAQTVQTKVNGISLHHGGDYPEAGYEALWQLVKGDDTTVKQTTWKKFGNYSAFSAGTVARTPKTAGRWGGGQFRDNSLPVVVHITDTTAHDIGTNCDTKSQVDPTKTTCIPYDPAYVDVDQDNTGKYAGGHYSPAVHKAYQERGARIISIYDNATDNERFGMTGVRQLRQLIDTSTATTAIVPVCAFKKDASSWKCGEDKCCTLMDKSGKLQGVAPVDKQCVLSYGIANGTVLSDALVDGVDALVKYATSEVAVRVKGNKIANSDNDTSCFIKRVEAFEILKDSEGNDISGYVRPPQEPETTCNPVAKATTFDNAEYLNGYTNFAIGTSSKDKVGAKLNFHIIAQNDTCVKPTEQAQVFEAYIELYEPKTGMSFGERKVSIVVPGEKSVIIVN
ncbi:MAG: hypothetical protein II767_03270 [Proteobacteria bacterium]|nr:hypothetical protein [Pseudomonadota bacterium]